MKVLKGALLSTWGRFPSRGRPVGPGGSGSPRPHPPPPDQQQQEQHQASQQQHAVLRHAAPPFLSSLFLLASRYSFSCYSLSVVVSLSISLSLSLSLFLSIYLRPFLYMALYLSFSLLLFLSLTCLCSCWALPTDWGSSCGVGRRWGEEASTEQKLGREKSCDWLLFTLTWSTTLIMLIFSSAVLISIPK